jgi:hypothetical protein
MPKQLKRKPGRPKLGKDQAKAKIAPIQFTGFAYQRIAVAAKNASQTVSQWIRSTRAAAVEG